jgi:Domain of unknown function (DUF1937)
MTRLSPEEEALFGPLLLPTNPFWYLATPYAKYPAGREAAFQEAAKQAALLIGAGYSIFCPITHTHPIAQYMTLKPDVFWIEFDYPFMDAAEGLILCEMESWKISQGMQMESDYFSVHLQRPVIHMKPGIIPQRLIEYEHRKR